LVSLTGFGHWPRGFFCMAGTSSRFFICDCSALGPWCPVRFRLSWQALLTARSFAQFCSCSVLHRLASPSRGSPAAGLQSFSSRAASVELPSSHQLNCRSLLFPLVARVTRSQQFPPRPLLGLATGLSFCSGSLALA
jgi:hypothetical protein